MKNKTQKIIELIFAHPLSSNIKWKEIEALFVDLGAEIVQREGSRVAIIWKDEVKVFHRPHPSPNTDKGAIASVRKWLDLQGVRP